MACRGHTGMRRGELPGLTWRALELHRARLQVTQQLIPTTGGCTFGPPKCKRGERTVALDAVTIEVLEHHRAVQLLERDLASPAYEDGDLVFCDEIGRPIRPQKLTDAFRRLRKAAGIPTGSLRILRHTAVTLALTATRRCRYTSSRPVSATTRRPSSARTATCS